MAVKRYFFLSLLICGHAMAEGGSCPPGYYPIGGQSVAGCAPMPGSGVDRTADTTPRGKWKTTWSAIAIDSMVGDVGMATGYYREGEARREAIRRCELHGAKKCKAETFFNQCSVLAWPTTPGGNAVSAGAGSLELAKANALSECASSGGGKCDIVGEQCAEPVFDRF